MERIEKIGLGVALIGHAGLIGSLYLGLLSTDQPIAQQTSISVDIIADIADISTAPDAIQEEPAPSAQSDSAEDDAAADDSTSEQVTENRVQERVAEPISNKPTPVRQKAEPKKPERKPEPKPASKPKPKPASKPAPKPKPAAKPAAKPRGFSKDFASSFEGKGEAQGTPASQTAAEVRRSVTVSLSSQIERFFKRCAPSGVDVNKITTAATLNLSQSGGLISITNIGQRGINSSNSAQADLHKECVNNAIKAAAPFSNLPADNYAIWKSWPMEFNTK